MAFLESIFGGSKITSIGETGGDPIELDASAREVHSMSGDVSDHPVESGTDIVDNYRVLPRTVQIDGVVTNSPLGVQYPGQSLINSAIGLIQGDEDPLTNAFQEFERFFDEAVVLTITTSLREYPNMVLTGLDTTRDAENASKLTFTATARQVRFVDTEEGAALTIPKEVTGQVKKSAGKATNSSAKQPEAQQSSALLKIFQSTGTLN